MLASGLAVAAPALAAPESEIVTRWADGTPASSTPGQVVVAEVRINVNDDQIAPDNTPIDNFTATFVTTAGKFTALPDACLSNGVTPASSISADGSNMICNFGTQVEGTALALQVPMTTTGVNGEQLTFDASVGDVAAPQLKHDIISEFMMDLTLEMPAATSTSLNANRLLDFQYTLNWGVGSDKGPDTVSYVLTVDPTVGTLNGLVDCSPFTAQLPSGHPNSGAGSPAERTAPFADCTITRIGATNQFNLTLSNIDYSLAQVPTETSGGDPLPVDRVAVASGQFVVDITSAQPGSVTVAVDTPTYTSVNDATSIDDPANNSASKAYMNRGLWVSGWERSFTGSGGGYFDDTYRVSPGTNVMAFSYFDQATQSLPLADDQNIATCQILDNKYVDYVSANYGSQPGSIKPADAQLQWYVGSSQSALDPNSAGYDPGSLNNCGGLTGGNWVDVEPADLTTVQAVQLVIPFGTAKTFTSTSLNVQQTVQADAPVGIDVWQFSSRLTDSWAPGAGGEGIITPTPDARHAGTTIARDILRVVGLTPKIAKTTDTTSLAIGEAATFTLKYSANGGAAAPETVDGYKIVDRLPVGMTYVAGSASPEPAIDSTPTGQVLTWTFDGLTTNTVHTLTYQAAANEDAVPGARMENVAVASVQGQASAEAKATVTIASNGRTIIGKSADQELIPNIDGAGNGTGSWTVTLRSEDPFTQSYTDVIDILPYVGDARGTAYSGGYAVTDVVTSAGETVYYTTTDPATLTDDPADASNGSAGDIADNTVGWSATAPADASAITAIRVIGGDLLPGAVRSFQIVIDTDGAVGGDEYVNRAQGRASHTELVMRTSATTAVAAFNAFELKKYVLDAEGNWHDAQDENEADWPTLAPGSTAKYKFVVTNVGQSDLLDIVATDPMLDVTWEIPELASGESIESEVYEFDLTGTTTASVRNEACAEAPVPAGSTQTELPVSCDEANVEVGGFTVSKTSDPASTSEVQVGDVITYSVEVRHTGKADVLGSFRDTLTEVLDDASYNNDVEASAGKVTVAGDIVTWSGNLAAGDIVTVTYSVTVTAQGDKKLVNVVLPIGGECVPAPDQNPDCKTIHNAVNPPGTPLASTGMGSAAGSVLAGLLILLIGSAIFVVGRRRRMTV